VAKRVSEHENIEMAEETYFPLSTVEVLIAPTLPFLDRMLTAIGPLRDAVLEEFPVPTSIVMLQMVSTSTVAISLIG
jgi:hypothetical protein